MSRLHVSDQQHMHERTDFSSCLQINYCKYTHIHFYPALPIAFELISPVPLRSDIPFPLCSASRKRTLI